MVVHYQIRLVQRPGDAKEQDLAVQLPFVDHSADA